MNIRGFSQTKFKLDSLTVNSQHTQPWLCLGINLTSSKKIKVNGPTLGLKVNMASFETTKLTFQVGP